MSILVSEKHKILFILSHKCGQCTISTYLKRLDNNTNDIHADYYNDNRKEISEEYLSYFKILILRNPYERFVSGFLQECIIQNNEKYKKIDMTFEEYCLFLLSIYDKNNINKYSINFTHNDEKNVNKLDGHLQSQFVEISDALNMYGKSIDIITDLKNINNVLKTINNKLNVNIITTEKNNAKKYFKEYTHSATKMLISDIAKGRSYPTWNYFYNDKIKNIIDQIYHEDFDLLKKYNMFQNVKINYSEVEQLKLNMNLSKKIYDNKYCMLIIPDKKIVYSDFVRFLESTKKYNLCEIYVMTDVVISNIFQKDLENTNIHTITNDYSEISSFTKLKINNYLNMLNTNYDFTIIYNELPTFINDLKNENIYEINKNDFIEKNIHIKNYSNVYEYNVDGVVIKSETLKKILTEITNNDTVIESEYQLLNVLIPTILTTDFPDQVIYNINTTLWTNLTPIDKNLVSYTLSAFNDTELKNLLFFDINHKNKIVNFLEKNPEQNIYIVNNDNKTEDFVNVKNQFKLQEIKPEDVNYQYHTVLIL